MSGERAWWLPWRTLQPRIEGMQPRGYRLSLIEDLRSDSIRLCVYDPESDVVAFERIPLASVQASESAAAALLSVVEHAVNQVAGAAFCLKWFPPVPEMHEVLTG